MAQLENETETARRKQDLIKGMNKLGIYYSTDGRRLKELSLAQLEWDNVIAQNKRGERLYGGNQ